MAAHPHLFAATAKLEYRISKALIPGYRGNRGFMDGLPEFRKLYESGVYEAVYGKSLEALEKEWRMAL